MTHARKNASLGQYRGEGRGHTEDWSHDKAVGGASPREGGAKNDMAKEVKAGNDSKSRRLPKHSLKMSGTRRGTCGTERKRKLYPLRGRGDALRCHVLLTRLDERRNETQPNRTQKSYKMADRSRESIKERRRHTDGSPAPEPRRRRLASLNAEALNSLLLEKSNAAKDKTHARGVLWNARKKASLGQYRGEGRGHAECWSPDEAVGGASLQEGGAKKADRTKLTKKQAAGEERTRQRLRRASKSEMCQSLEKARQDEASLYAPTPRRMAGLNAAALLKLTSATHRPRAEASKHRKPTAQKSPQRSGACRMCPCCQSRLALEGSPERPHLGKPGYTLGYPIPLLKEEPDLSPLYVCPREGPLELCRLALVLGQREEPDCLALRTHPCLCTHPSAQRCYPGYYVHIVHPAPVRSLSGPTLPCARGLFCPVTYALQPLASACALCSTKTGLSSSPSPPLLSARRLALGRECPGNTSSAHRPARPARAKAQRRWSRRQTNGWRPVGEPSPREVFIAGDEETAVRRCYEGVQRDGEVIRVRDTVLLRSGPRRNTTPYVAKISALWEEPRTGELMMSLFWYYRPEHTQAGRDPSMHCENEIFASRHQDENSVACIEERCYVLTLAQYCRFCAVLKRGAAGVCERPLVPVSSDASVPPHRRVPAGVDPQLVYLCRHVYDYRYGRILKNLQ